MLLQYEWQKTWTQMPVEPLRCRVVLKARVSQATAAKYFEEQCGPHETWVWILSRPTMSHRFVSSLHIGNWDSQMFRYTFSHGDLKVLALTGPSVRCYGGWIWVLKLKCFRIWFGLGFSTEWGSVSFAWSLKFQFVAEWRKCFECTVCLSRTWEQILRRANERTRDFFRDAKQARFERIRGKIWGVGDSPTWSVRSQLASFLCNFPWHCWSKSARYFCNFLWHCASKINNGLSYLTMKRPQWRSIAQFPEQRSCWGPCYLAHWRNGLQMLHGIPTSTHCMCPSWPQGVRRSRKVCWRWDKGWRPFSLLVWQTCCFICCSTCSNATNVPWIANSCLSQDTWADSLANIEIIAGLVEASVWCEEGTCM